MKCCKITRGRGGPNALLPTLKDERRQGIRTDANERVQDVGERGDNKREKRIDEPKEKRTANRARRQRERARPGTRRDFQRKKRKNPKEQVRNKGNPNPMLSHLAKGEANEACKKKNSKKERERKKKAVQSKINCQKGRQATFRADPLQKMERNTRDSVRRNKRC